MTDLAKACSLVVGPSHVLTVSLAAYGKEWTGRWRGTPHLVVVHVRRVAIVDEPWTVDNGFITPTLKIKRNALETRYQPLVDEWMRQNRPVVWESPAETTARQKACAERRRKVI